MDELRTDYKDRLLDTSVNTERKFNLVDQDGNVIASEVSLRDITQYSQTGDTFGAADINKITAKINEQNNNLAQLGGFTPVIDDTGKITGYTTTKGGADTVFPFHNGELFYSDSGTGGSTTLTLSVPAPNKAIINLTVGSHRNSTINITVNTKHNIIKNERRVLYDRQLQLTSFVIEVESVGNIELSITDSQASNIQYYDLNVYK